MATCERLRTRAEIFAAAQHRIEYFKKLQPGVRPDYAEFLLDKHFEHVNRLIDKDIS